jgi:hypothetical protein
VKQRLTAAVSVAFKLECRDKQGNLLKTVDVKGSVPLAKLQEALKEAKK